MPVLTKINTNAIADDAVTGDKFSSNTYLQNTVNQDISGTYSDKRLYTSDAYTVAGNVNVTGHLGLGTITDGDITLTNDSSVRTIEGSGTIESGEIINEPNTNLTGMTGELGSVVTGSPNLNLGNATFPVGHVIQTVHSGALSGGGSHNQTAWQDIRQCSSTIVPLKTNSKILITLSCNLLLTSGIDSGGPRQRGYVGIFRTNDLTILVSQQILVDDVSDIYLNFTMNYLDSPTITDPPSAITYGLATKGYQLSNTNCNIYSDDGGPTHITMMEIAQ